MSKDFENETMKDIKNKTMKDIKGLKSTLYKINLRSDVSGKLRFLRPLIKLLYLLLFFSFILIIIFNFEVSSKDADKYEQIFKNGSTTITVDSVDKQP